MAGAVGMSEGKWPGHTNFEDTKGTVLLGRGQNGGQLRSMARLTHSFQIGDPEYEKIKVGNVESGKETQVIYVV